MAVGGIVFCQAEQVKTLTTHRDHFKGRGGDAKDALFSEQDTIVLIDNERGEVYITGMGRAIGHYARWIPRGAVRLEVVEAIRRDD